MPLLEDGEGENFFKLLVLLIVMVRKVEDNNKRMWKGNWIPCTLSIMDLHCPVATQG